MRLVALPRPCSRRLGRVKLLAVYRARVAFLLSVRVGIWGDRQTPKTSCIRVVGAIIFDGIRRCGIGPEVEAMDVACDCHACGD